MTFEEYLISKKIDSQAFAQAEKGMWEEWKRLFENMHANSFTSQKLFLINKIRRQFPAKQTEPVTNTTQTVSAPAKPKPVMRPKIN